MSKLPQTEASPAADTSLLALDRQFCFALYSASLAMTKTYKPLLEELGLTYPQYLVMLVLWQHADEQHGPGVKEIGQALCLDSGTLTPLLKRLEAAGLIVRQRSAQDERQVHILLSAAGRALQTKAAEIPPQILCASGQNVERLSQMRSDLIALRDTLIGN